MYRHILSDILTDHFVKGSGWSEERAIELGRQVLRSNVDEIFPRPNLPADAAASESGNGDPVTINETADTISIVSDHELDPLPSHDEIQSANAEDVQLFDDSVEQRHPDPEALASNLDPQTLDVGDILGSESSTDPDIRMLRGEESFEVDEASLLLRPDPSTGELKFPSTDSDEDASPSDE